MSDTISGAVSRNTSASHASTFDAIRRIDEYGEWWSARELMPLMGYDQWRRFEDSIERALAAARNAGHDTDGAFCRRRQEDTGGRPRQDYRLTRLAAYLIAMNGDPRKAEVAAAQTYFTVRTREAEVAEAEAAELPEWARQQIATIRRVGRLEVEQQAQGERLTAVESRVDGIQGHYNWFTALGYARWKGLPTSRKFAQNLGRYAANICRRDGIQVEKAQDERFGSVGSYPVEVLEEAAQLLGQIA
jgi:DNA-damage-inducible protein D